MESKAKRNVDKEALIHLVALAALAVGAGYLVWRVGWTVNTDALWLAVPLLVAEVHGYLTYIGFMFMTWDISPLPKPPPLRGASVDFFIPTYNEPFSVLAPTIAGALAVRYPHQTWVLDDGRRPWVRALCKRLGARYLVRDDNLGAKAGNINAALPRTTCDFICVVDADFIPSPHFIDEVIGYFNDPEVAIVQGPQEFYNLDSFQHMKGDMQRWHEQSVFFQTIQAGKNHSNAAFWCGCPSMLRRSALLSIGGVASETVTEDLHTSIKLHSAGWKTVYHPNIIALGVAPNDYDGFIMQRLRWAEGTMQVLRSAWNTPGLTIGQRINYVASTSTYFDALRKAFFFAVVPLVLMTDQLPISADMSLFLPIWVGQFVLSTTANVMLSRGHNRPLMTEFFDTLKMFAFIRASVTLISGKRAKFRVTPKGQPGERRLHALLVPFAVLIAVYTVAVGVGLARLFGVGLTTDNPAAMTAAVLWGLGLAVFLAEVTAYGYRKVSQRSADRVSLDIIGFYWDRGRVSHEVIIRDLTTVGASFLADEELAPGSRIELAVGRSDFSFKAVVRRCAPTKAGYLVGVEAADVRKIHVHLATAIAENLFNPPLQVPPTAVPPPLLQSEVEKAG